MSTRLLPSVSRWSRAALCLGLLGSLIAACSVLIDHDGNQCNTDADCASLGSHPHCTADHVCQASGLGPDGCFSGTPSQPSDFANQCSTAQCVPFDNCARLKLCKDTDMAAPPVVPPDATSTPPGDAPDQSGQTSCVVNGRTSTVVIGGSTAVQNFMPSLAKILAAGTTSYALAYQPSGSCTGVDNIFNSAKQTVKDIPGKQALLYHGDGTSEPCTFGAGTTLDVAVSDVFASSCTATYATGATIGEYLGPIQPMTFVVPANADQQAISAELGHYIFGRPKADTLAAPYDDPTLHFVRNSGSGTQQMIARAIGVNAAQWWGVDSGSSGKVRDTLEAVAVASLNSAMGILSTDVTDPVRSQLRVLAFKGTGQICGYYPDSTLNARDKANVRDGHYSIWGPIHFYSHLNNGLPSDQAAALVTQFTLPQLPDSLLNAITDIGFVPPCAMKVQRKAEMGDISSYAPTYQCGCYYETRLAGVAPAGCQACTTNADCPTDRPACNQKFCEVK